MTLLGFAFARKPITYVSVDYKKGEYITYQNISDSTDKHVIKFDHLGYMLSIPKQFPCAAGKLPEIRLLEIGFLYITQPLLATTDELSAEARGRKSGKNHWKDSISKDVKPQNVTTKKNNLLVKIIPQNNIQPDTQNKTDPTIQTKNPLLKTKSVHKGEITTYTYQKTFNNNIIYKSDKSLDGFSASVSRLKVDYALVQLIRCDTNKNLRLFLIRVGAVALRNQSKVLYNYNERHAEHLSQDDRLGIWRNYDEEHHNTKAYIIMPYPPESAEYKYLFLPFYQKWIWQLGVVMSGMSQGDQMLVKLALILLAALIVYFVTIMIVKRIHQRNQNEPEFIRNKRSEITIGLIVAIASAAFASIFTF